MHGDKNEIRHASQPAYGRKEAEEVSGQSVSLAMDCSLQDRASLIYKYISVKIVLFFEVEDNHGSTS